ncbi:MAG: Na(+)/H(+) antiporter subunit F1 [Clostridia bacterium]|jgi:multicomponent Na+:H+ antiporter subunit F|nr:Na(+)/H(+) antiporter subunit F1 [Clostridia bacterium]
MFNLLLLGALFVFAVAIALFLYRVCKGPSIPDRIIAMDAIGVSLIAMMAILSILLKTDAFFEVILLFGILSFIGTVSFAKFIERGVLVDYDRNR